MVSKAAQFISISEAAGKSSGPEWKKELPLQLLDHLPTEKALEGQMNSLEEQVNALEVKKEALEEREKALDYGACAVCLKVNEHRSGNCPHLIEVPEGATLVPDYALICKCCNDVGRHPGKRYRARTMRKFCVNCEWEPHWTEECPYQVPEYSRLPQTTSK